MEIEIKNLGCTIVGITPENPVTSSNLRRIRVTYLVDVETDDYQLCIKHSLTLHENGDITFPDEPKDFVHLNTACRVLFGISSKSQNGHFIKWIQDIGKSEVYHYGGMIKSVDSWLYPPYRNN